MTGVFEGVGTLQFSPDNKHAYAYSGVVSVNNSETELLQFNTNSEYIVGNWFANFNQLTADPLASEDFRFILYLNDIQIAIMETADSQQATRNTIQNIIIPPFTNVRITGRNYTGSVTEPCGVVLTGKVNGAIEQENLESITDNSKWASK